MNEYPGAVTSHRAGVVPFKRWRSPRHGGALSAGETAVHLLGMDPDQLVREPAHGRPLPPMRRVVAGRISQVLRSLLGIRPNPYQASCHLITSLASGLASGFVPAPGRGMPRSSLLGRPALETERGTAP